MLNYKQKMILAAFEKLYDKKYTVDESDYENQRNHDLCQNMGYLLKVYWVELGDYDYSLNGDFPYSPALHAEIRRLDRKSNEIDEFHNSDEYKSGFIPKEKEISIINLRKTLNIENHKEDLLEWMAKISRNTYESITLKPIKDFSLDV